MAPSAPSSDQPSRPTMIDTALRIGLVALLVYACSRILLPFAGILVWSAILAVMLYPLHLRLVVRLGNRWSALLIGLVGVVVMTGADGHGGDVARVVHVFARFELAEPGPDRAAAAAAWLADLPLVGQKLTETWVLVATNVPAALAKYGQMLKGPAAWLASFAGGLASGELSFVLSFAIAAVLVAYGEGAAEFARRLLERVTGSKARAARLVTLTAATIRGVALGVVGVAVIQSVLIGIGFFAIGLPAAGLLTLATLLLGIVQVPVILVTLPVVVYVFATEATTPAVIFMVWSVIAGLSDNVLKPLMLGRGLEVPMPVILIGVIGGMLADGLLGLFVGPVLLAVHAPVKTLDEFIAGDGFHSSLKAGLEADARVSDGLNQPEYKNRLLRRQDLRQAVMNVIAANTLDAILYPHQRRLVVPIGEEQVERNGVLSNSTGFPALAFPGGFSRPTPSAPLGVPVGIEILGPDFSEPTLIAIAFAFEQIAKPRRAPASTPPLGR